MTDTQGHGIDNCILSRAGLLECILPPRAGAILGFQFILTAVSRAKVRTPTPLKRTEKYHPCAVQDAF